MMECYSAIEKNEIMPSAAKCMDLEIVILSDINQTKTNIWYSLYVELKKKMIHMNLYTKLTDIENKLMVIKAESWGRDKLGVWDWHTHTSIYKIDDQQEPTV